MHTDINACTHTRGCADTIKGCTESWLWEKNSFLHQGIEPASAKCLSDVLPTELHPNPCVSRDSSYFFFSLLFINLKTFLCLQLESTWSSLTCFLSSSGDDIQFCFPTRFEDLLLAFISTFFFKVENMRTVTFQTTTLGRPTDCQKAVMPMTTCGRRSGQGYERWRRSVTWWTCMACFMNCPLWAGLAAPGAWGQSHNTCAWFQTLRLSGDSLYWEAIRSVSSCLWVNL